MDPNDDLLYGRGCSVLFWPSKAKALELWEIFMIELQYNLWGAAYDSEVKNLNTTPDLYTTCVKTMVKACPFFKNYELSDVSNQCYASAFFLFIVELQLQRHSQQHVTYSDVTYTVWHIHFICAFSNFVTRKTVVTELSVYSPWDSLCCFFPLICMFWRKCFATHCNVFLHVLHRTLTICLNNTLFVVHLSAIHLSKCKQSHTAASHILYKNVHCES